MCRKLIFEELIGDQPPNSPYLWIRVSINIKFGAPSSGKKQIESDCDLAAEDNMDHNC
jgi:hypothetical protein